MENTNDLLSGRPKLRRKDAFMREDTPSVGRTLGRYKIVSKLGSGGMGDVYLAEDMHLQRKVAIKVIKLEAIDPVRRRESLERFQREARAAANVSHPNVVTIYDFVEIAGENLLVMEYLPGTTLRDRIEGDKALLPDNVVRHAFAILSGLEAIHQARMVHRDLKPHNLMLLPDGRLKIFDLGLVKYLEGQPDLTQFGFAMGSPFYMAPEQIMALTRVGEIDKRADIYALGVVLFQLLSGKPPFNGKLPQQILDHHIRKPVPPLRSPHGPIPDLLREIVFKAMSKNPNDRYQTAIEMRADIERVPRRRKKSTGPQQALPQAAAAVTLPETLKRKGSSSDRIRQATFKDLPTLPRTRTPTGPQTPSRQRPKSVPPPIPAAALRKKPRRSRRMLYLGAAVVMVSAVASLVLALQPSLLGQNAPVAIAQPYAFSENATTLSPKTVPMPDAATAVPTASDGCRAYKEGDPGRAIAILKPLVSPTTTDHEARYCLCAAEHLLQDASARRDCEAYLQTQNRDKEKDFQVRMWLKKR